MPTELLKEFIGLVCEISLFDGIGTVAMLEAVEGNWLKINDDGRAKLVNGNLVRYIAPMPEKYQEKYRRKQNR